MLSVYLFVVLLVALVIITVIGNVFEFKHMHWSFIQKGKYCCGPVLNAGTVTFVSVTTRPNSWAPSTFETLTLDADYAGALNATVILNVCLKE